MATWRRKRKRVNWGAVEYGWNSYIEKPTAANVSDQRTAYRCVVEWDDIGGQLRRTFVAAERSECATVDDALLRLRGGETVTVAGSDMQALRTRLAGLGVGG